MTTQKELTHKEIMLINDLLDGQLSPDKAKQAFLAIERDQTLRMAYEKLRWTKSLLRQAPRRKVPHNFTLTRQMAKEATGFYRLRRQTFSIAGALASFLFVVLLAVQLLPMGFKAAMPAMDMENEVAMMEEAAPLMMPAAEEEALEEAEIFAMEAETELAEPAQDESLESIPTNSASEASGGGGEEALTEEETISEMADSNEDQVGMGEAQGDRLPEQESEETAHGFAAADEEISEEAPMAPGDILTKEIISEEPTNADQNVRKQPGEWLFLATVLTGLLAFVFIFISLRDRNHE